MKKAIYFPISHDAQFADRIDALKERMEIKSDAALARKIFHTSGNYQITDDEQLNENTVQLIRKRIAAHKENQNPQMKFIKEYCDSLDCEADFLLGYIDFPKRENQTIYDITGLTDTAINTLKRMHGQPFEQKNLDLLNFMLSDARFFCVYMDTLMLYIDNKYDTPLHIEFDANGNTHYVPNAHEKNNILAGNDLPTIEIGKKSNLTFNGKPLYDPIGIPVSMLMDSYASYTIQNLLSQLKEAYLKQIKENNETTK